MHPSRLAQSYPRIPPDVVTLVLQGHARGDETLARRILNRITTQQIDNLRAELRLCNGYSGVSTQRAEQRAEPEIDLAEVLTLFDKCRVHGVEEGGDDAVDAMQGAGLPRFCEELGVDPYSDPFVLIFAWLGRAATPYQISRAEYITAVRALRCGTVAALEAQVRDVRALPQRAFSDFYTFAFRWSKPADQKLLELDMTIELWKIVLTLRPWPLQESWFAFLHNRKLRGVSRDVWRECLRFAAEHPDGVTDHDFEGGAWPVIIDDFAEHMMQAK
eukprot:TRINITY_DN32741_c0_g1_i1.p2 TRINITY_DN32741_c0_g1~~TRINITY_DN32741_c0_g1_i1.p2  ORF type:complete len:274 (+),score=80.21 TRINITY_DN32741_c0_g1_i1:84-905(+)